MNGQSGCMRIVGLAVKSANVWINLSSRSTWRIRLPPLAALLDCLFDVQYILISQLRDDRYQDCIAYVAGRSHQRAVFIATFEPLGDNHAMPKRNRVTPLGEIVAVPERGTMMGNRGILHDADGRIVRHWKLKQWLICVLEFNGRHRTIMTPNRYTELFFLDEATALSAGHRPCFECRRARYVAFRDAWAAGNCPNVGPASIKVKVIDDRLHVERVGADRVKATYPAKLDDLPDGVFVNLVDWDGHEFLVWGDQLLAWSPGGYRNRLRRPRNETAKVLTPRSTVNAIRSGYLPEIHPSAWNVR